MNAATGRLAVLDEGEIALDAKSAAAISTPAGRMRFLTAHPEWDTSASLSRLTSLVPQLVRSNRDRAMAVAELVMTIALQLREAEAVAEAVRAKANALHAFGRNAEAVVHHRRAARIFRSAGNAGQLARTLSSSIQPLILQGHYKAASAAAEEARAIFAAEGDKWRLARVELNAGNILDRQDRFGEALHCYQRAYRYLKKIAIQDPEAVAIVLHNMTVAYVSLNDLRRAESTYKEARRFASHHGMHVLAGQADYNIAWLYYLRGNYTRAISMLRESREEFRVHNDAYHLALCRLDLSEVYLELNLGAEAEETAEQAEQSFGQLGMRYERAKALTNFAIAQAKQGRASEALQQFTQARRLFRKEKNRVLPSLVDLYRAVVLYGQERDGEARTLCVAALRAFRQFRIANKTAVSQMLLARIDLRRGNLIRARQECSQALRAAVRLESPVLACEGNALKGQIEEACGHPQLAHRSYSRARTYLEQLRDSICGEELKISFMKDRVQIYEALVALELDRPNSATAANVFSYVQQAKSRSLLDSLSASRSASGFSSAVQGEPAARVQQLREELNWFLHKTEAGLLKEAPREEIAKLRVESQRRERELLSLIRECGSLSARDRLQQTAVPLGVDQIRSTLPADTVLLEYFQARDQIIVALLDRRNFEIIPLTTSSRIAESFDLLQFQLSKVRLGSQYLNSFGDTLSQATHAHLECLYRELVAPLIPLIRGQHLVIAPHGRLHQLPFHALSTGSRYLIDEVTISYVPSASVYAFCRRRSNLNKPSSLVMGIPDARAPLVAEEVEAVTRSVPDPIVFLGADATADVLRQKGVVSRYIHIATHGSFRRDNPMFSAIRLGDSFLTLLDLYQLKLPAELVTLSGCSTALNVVAAGDELLGLARGLIHAGAESTLLTLWDVQDRSTARFMAHFYRNIADGMEKPVALQRAMQELRLEYPHPYYWAPFVLVGKT